jgi:protein involved in plasmid replication-relaxation
MNDTAITEPARRRRFHRSEEPPVFQLTERDVEIVRQVARYRFLRSTHISQLLDASHKKICERLTLLYHAGYLDRPRAQLEYHAHNGGSAPYVYALDSQGSRLLKGCGELDQANVDWLRKNRDRTRQFLLHTLSIADFCVALTIACRSNLGVRLLGPDELLQSAPKQTRLSRTPWNWRVRVPFKGQTSEIGVIPDYVFALMLPDGRRRPFIVECDRGTMPIERTSIVQTSMLRKFLAYEATRAQAVHTSRFAWKNFRVLVSTTSGQRHENMRELINRAMGASPLFLFAELSLLTQSKFFGQAWQGADGNLLSLI